MTEERIKELARKTPFGWTQEHTETKKQLIRTVAAEAREEGRAEGIEKVLKFFEEGEEETMWRPNEITDAIERLKEG